MSRCVTHGGGSVLEESGWDAGHVEIALDQWGKRMAKARRSAVVRMDPARVAPPHVPSSSRNAHSATSPQYCDSLRPLCTYEYKIQGSRVTFIQLTPTSSRPRSDTNMLMSNRHLEVGRRVRSFKTLIRQIHVGNEVF